MIEDRTVNCPTCSTKCTIVKFCGCKESGCDGDPHYVINESYYRKKFAKELLELKNKYIKMSRKSGSSMFEEAVSINDIKKVL